MSRIKGQEKGKKGIRFLSLPPKPPFRQVCQQRTAKDETWLHRQKKTTCLEGSLHLSVSPEERWQLLLTAHIIRLKFVLTAIRISQQLKNTYRYKFACKDLKNNFKKCCVGGKLIRFWT